MNGPTIHLPADFFATCWEKQVFVACGAALKNFANDSAQSFIERYGESIKVFTPGKPEEKGLVSPDAALQLLEGGCTLYLVNYQKYDERCNELLAAFHRVVGPADGRVSIFLSNAGDYMPFHWDTLNNFTYQLKGRKTWLLAPNEQVRYPMENFAAGRGQGPGDGAIRPNRRRVTKTIMEPGSLLYVPRGHWHATRTHHASISLSVNFEPAVLADLVSRNLRRELLNLEAFRKNLQGTDRQELEAMAALIVQQAMASLGGSETGAGG